MEYIYKIDMIESHRFLRKLFGNKKKPMSKKTNISKNQNQH